MVGCTHTSTGFAARTTFFDFSASRPPSSDLSSTSNCSGCLGVSRCSEELGRLKREFEDLQRLILSQKQVQSDAFLTYAPSLADLRPPPSSRCWTRPRTRRAP